jgi:hypothetical protein
VWERKSSRAQRDRRPNEDPTSRAEGCPESIHVAVRRGRFRATAQLRIRAAPPPRESWCIGRAGEMSGESVDKRSEDRIRLRQLCVRRTFAKRHRTDRPFGVGRQFVSRTVRDATVQLRIRGAITA